MGLAEVAQEEHCSWLQTCLLTPPLSPSMMCGLPLPGGTAPRKSVDWDKAQISALAKPLGPALPAS